MRVLPVVDDAGRLLGTVGLRELAASGRGLMDVLSEACTARAHSPALDLVAGLTDGMTHAFVIIDDVGRVSGIVSQTDLLGVLGQTSRMRG